MCRRLKLSPAELREDIDVLNVVASGRHLCAPMRRSTATRSRSTRSPTGDSFARPARLLPLEAKALVAIDLFGDHCRGQGCTVPARRSSRPSEHDPSEEGSRSRPAAATAPTWPERGDRLPPRARAQLLQGERGPVHQASGRALPARTVARAGTSSATTSQGAVRHFKLDRVKEASLTAESFGPAPRWRRWQGRGLDGRWRDAGRRGGRGLGLAGPRRWLREERTVIEGSRTARSWSRFRTPEPRGLCARSFGAGDLVVLEPEDAREAIAKEVAT